jgi:hypothetical protein
MATTALSISDSIQGFRQVLGTTQVFPVPTFAERQGIDTLTFPGDTLTVPVNPSIVAVLNHYPLPNDPTGAYGDRTYAASSKIYTRTDQFSLRIDHRISEKGTLMTRFSLNQVTGPLTNPNQTAIDPSFGVQFFDHQRNAGVKYSRTITPRLISDSSFSYIRSTPFFPTLNHTQPALTFGDGLFQGYNSAGGSIFGSFGNLFQFKQDFSYVHSSHAFKVGAEIRFNRDATIFGTNPNGISSLMSDLALHGSAGQTHFTILFHSPEIRLPTAVFSASRDRGNRALSLAQPSNKRALDIFPYGNVMFGHGKSEHHFRCFQRGC